MGTRNPEVDAWFDRYENPMKEVALRTRELMLDADERIGETIKWSTPTFIYRGNLASFQPRAKQFVSLLFHTGASIPGEHPSSRVAETSRATSDWPTSRRSSATSGDG